MLALNTFGTMMTFCQNNIWCQHVLDEIGTADYGHISFMKIFNQHVKSHQIWWSKWFFWCNNWFEQL